MNIDVRSGPGQRRRSPGRSVSGQPKQPSGQGRQGHEPCRLHGRGCGPGRVGEEVAERPVVRDRPWLRPVSGAQSVRQDRHPGRELLRPWQSFLAT
jgi:hypothetical protein